MKGFRTSKGGSKPEITTTAPATAGHAKELAVNGRVSKQHVHPKHDMGRRESSFSPYKDCMCDIKRDLDKGSGVIDDATATGGLVNVIVHENGKTSTHLPDCKVHRAQKRAYDPSTIASDILRAEGDSDLVMPLNMKIMEKIRRKEEKKRKKQLQKIVVELSD